MGPSAGMGPEIVSPCQPLEQLNRHGVGAENSPKKNDRRVFTERFLQKEVAEAARDRLWEKDNYD